jgi:hypothetical protein
MRNRIVFLCLCAAFLLLTSTGAAQDKPLYTRIRLSTGPTVYVQFSEKQMRLADSAAKLKKAEPISGTETKGRWHYISFPETDLPFPAARLPRGVSKIRSKITLYRKPSISAFVSLGMCYQEKKRGKDGEEEKVSEWMFVTNVEKKPGRSASTASTIGVPSLGKLKLKMVTYGGKGRVGIGMTCWSGRSKISGVVKDGKAVPIEIGIKDGAGKEVFSGRGGVNDFGFG